MTFLKTLILSILLTMTSYAADSKETQTIQIYENIHTSSFSGHSKAYALKTAFNNIDCQNLNVIFVTEPVCSEINTNMKSKIWECVVVYSCTNAMNVQIGK